MFLNPDEMSPIERYHFMTSALVPRPIAWVTTCEPNGKVNAAPYSFFAGISSSPPLLGVCVGRRRDGSSKDTLRNAKEEGEMVVNMCPFDLRDQMVGCSKDFPPGVSEIEKLRIETAPSETVEPPRIVGAKVSFECSVERIIEFGGTSMIVGRVLRFVAADDVLEDGRVSFGKLRPLGRLGGLEYLDLEEGVLEIPRPD